MMDKDLKKVIQALEAQGFEIRLTRRGRLAVFNGEEYVTTFSGKPGDWRAFKNALAALRRAGFRWPT
ncbi:hypothetical protein GCM10022215_29560 [Nocardioides fonticola]|uniref:HicA-like toxin of HicAB toxin-antitoxin system n=1 Tax=Nocardioides fonticola TaxID=450363 RepID=A0ABP7XP67_9ACTN